MIQAYRCAARHKSCLVLGEWRKSTENRAPGTICHGRTGQIGGGRPPRVKTSHNFRGMALCALLPLLAMIVLRVGHAWHSGCIVLSWGEARLISLAPVLALVVLTSIWMDPVEQDGLPQGERSGKPPHPKKLPALRQPAGRLVARTRSSDCARDDITISLSCAFPDLCFGSSAVFFPARRPVGFPVRYRFGYGDTGGHGKTRPSRLGAAPAARARHGVG